jgi:hypothetical protein
LWIWLKSGPSAGLSTGLGYLGSQLNQGMRNGLAFGLHFDLLMAVFSAILIWAMMGGLSTLRHYVIRLLLWRSHTFPLNAPRFLDDATARVLLRRVGGGYSLVHRLILDYFLSLDRPLAQPELSQPSQVIAAKVCGAWGYNEIRPAARFCPHCGGALTS